MIVCVTLFDNPPASFTVNVTLRVPAVRIRRAHDGPVAAPPGYLLRSHAYETIPASSVELVASNVQVSVGHDQVNFATGGLVCRR